jgi:hypothetical protein
MAVPVEAAVRKRVLRVVFISLLLDLVGLIPCPLRTSKFWYITGNANIYCTKVSFTFILPLFPSLLEFYRSQEAPVDFSSSQKSPTVLAHILSYLNAYKASFSKPIDSRYDIVLLGGALGSLFSCVASNIHISPAN